jgi:2-methylcitrate dehydratase PrpD
MMKRREFLFTTLAGAVGVATVPLSAFDNTAEGTSAGCSVPFPKAEGLTESVADFVLGKKLSDVPADVMELGKKSILDAFGLALYGATDETWKILDRYTAQFQSKDKGATVLGTDVRLPSRFAAFANGVAIHAEDFDDTQLATHSDRVYGLLTHPTVPVLPAALAVAELQPASGKDFMLAYHLGVEVECKVAEAIAPRHYEDGFHSTGTCGVFGSAIACAKLNKFSSEQIVLSMGLAASQSSGLRESFGTMTKPFHAGHAAEAGIIAADLVALGWTAAPKILEAPRGFFHAYGGTFDPETMKTLGRPWTFASPGVSIKPYPSGSLTHPAMTELQRIIREQKFKASDVESMEVGTNRNMPNALIHHQPKTALQAKFSMEFCMAILLIEGKAGLSEFTDSVVNRPDVQEMIGRVHFVVNPEAEAAGYDKMTSILKITLKNGRVIIGRADFAKGSPANPMTFDEVTEKFMGCAESAKWPTSKAKQIVESVRHLEDVPNMQNLTSLCRK